MVDWVVSLMAALGAPGAGIAIALENLFPPLPSEVILPLAGFTASRGEMNLIERAAVDHGEVRWSAHWPSTG